MKQLKVVISISMCRGVTSFSALGEKPPVPVACGGTEALVGEAVRAEGSARLVDDTDRAKRVAESTSTGQATEQPIVERFGPVQADALGKDRRA